MKTNVLLFAGLRERLKQDKIELDLPEGTKAFEVLPILFGKTKETEALARCTLFAINDCYVKPETRLEEGDELALIPPVAGG